MLSLYWRDDVPDDERLMVLRNWINVLGDLPGWAVMQACADWIAANEKRPTPAAIRENTQRLLKPYREEGLRRYGPAPEPEPKGERITKERAAEIMAEYGFKRMPKGVEE